MRIAYLTGMYPRATDTFIQREVFALREQGLEIFTFAVRRPGDEHIVGQEQQAERDRTFYILPTSLIALVLAHWALLRRSPKRYLQAIQLAWKTAQPGWRGGLYQLFYFIEAGILAQQLQDQHISHLHNHIADSAGTVAMVASALADVPFSFTLHGPYIFFEPYRWRLDEKIRRSQFVCCISHFCRSQAMIFAPLEKWRDLHIVHCGVDPALFQPVVHQGRGQRLLFTGRLATVKG
ncbi:MAG: glycosyltransferase family 4 protein, partial [Leptolyngbyaceae cyanobacterium SL_7_1]|nr:glycosyltransferase family 4 protein [Leptolyngbyaceae cyanobacterium SL_7_1]